MNCKICGSNGWINKEVRTIPDKYEKWMGIEDVKKRWRKCLGCGVWHHLRNYPLEDLEKIYSDGYRDERFRGETIGQAFLRLYNISEVESENSRRIDWLLNSSSLKDPGNMLDIGSGLGIFPIKLKKAFNIDVETVEFNEDSIELLRSHNILCTKEISDKKYDTISMTHVLEHIETPVEYLLSLHKYLESDGKLFIEVPDAIEFELLPPIHDDFNSCHTHFYDTGGLIKTLNRGGFETIDIHREHYKQRNLHRIMAVCRKTQ